MIDDGDVFLGVRVLVRFLTKVMGKITKMYDCIEDFAVCSTEAVPYVAFLENV